jgi:predicted XRE-type DNA-binding protein
VKKNKDDYRARHVTTGSVFDDLGFSPTESAALKMKADLLDAILKIVAKNGYRQRDLVKILGQPQPRVSELLRGKISSTSIEKLLDYVERLGAVAAVRVSFGRAA